MLIYFVFSFNSWGPKFELCPRKEYQMRGIYLMSKNAMTAFLNWPQLKKLWVFIGVLVIESREFLLYYCIFCPGLGRWSKISTVLGKKATG